MRKFHSLSLTAILALSLSVVLSAIVIGASPMLPRCEEDVVVVGMGHFVNGRWSRYVCGPSLDDFCQPP